MELHIFRHEDLFTTVKIDHFLPSETKAQLPLITSFYFLAYINLFELNFHNYVSDSLLKNHIKSAKANQFSNIIKGSIIKT